MNGARLLGCLAVGTLVIAVSSCESTFYGCDQERVETATLPDSYLVGVETSRGAFDIMVHTAWGPFAADRFYKLVQAHVYDDSRFFRVVKGVVAQFGIPADPKVSEAWKKRCIGDERAMHSNERGTIAFARGALGSRSVQVFINLQNSPALDTMDVIGFAPFGKVLPAGLPVLDGLYADYGEAALSSGPQPGHEGPLQDSIKAMGNAYLKAWPKLDYIIKAEIKQEWKKK